MFVPFPGPWEGPWPQSTDIHQYRRTRTHTKQDRQLALELVHQGFSFRQAVSQTGVPKTTLIRTARACNRHCGPCQGAELRGDFVRVSVSQETAVGTPQGAAVDVLGFQHQQADAVGLGPAYPSNQNCGE